MKVKFVPIPGLAMGQPGKLLGVPEQELDLEPELVVLQNKPGAQRHVGTCQQHVPVGPGVQHQKNPQPPLELQGVEFFGVKVQVRDGYDWNLAEIIYNRIVKIVRRKKSS